MASELRPITEADINQHDILKPLLQNMLSTFQDLAKKKPEAVLSKAKVTAVNRLLTPIHKLLDSEPDRQFLDLLDEITLPQNSDVVLILGQTLAAMGNYFKAHHHRESYSTVWTTDENTNSDEEDDDEDVEDV